MRYVRFVGVDVHLRTSSVCVLDEQGQVVLRRTVAGGWSKLAEFVSTVAKPFCACFEASCGYGAVHDLLSRHAGHVVAAHAGSLRLIYRSKRKNDRVDAEKLAKLLYLDAVPAVHVPSGAVRAWRGLIEHRARLVRKRTRCKNQIKALVRGLGIEPPEKLWTGSGLEWLSKLELAERADALRRDVSVEELRETRGRLRRVEAELDRIGEGQAGIALLRTIPGVGARTAEAVLAYVDDPARFRSGRSLGCYFGLVPGQDSSASSNRLGHITQDGPASVRGLLAEAAWQGIRHSPTLRAFHARVMRGDAERKKIALVATARHLLEVMLAMLRSGEVWRESVSSPGSTSAEAA